METEPKEEQAASAASAVGDGGIDFEAEGLVEGLEGEARADRLALLAELEAWGFSADELRRACSENRLALLGVERFLEGGHRRYTLDELAERSGLEPEFIVAHRRALGLVGIAEQSDGYTESDLAALVEVRALRDAGLPDEGMLEVARVLGISMANVAAANRQLVGPALLRPGASERDMAHSLVEMAERVTPHVAPLLLAIVNLHQVDQIRRDVLGHAELERGEFPGAREVTVCFADLVGFTRLGEQLSAAEIASVTARFDELARAVAESPVILVKMIGDGAMFVCDEAGPLLDAALRLSEAVEGEGERYPQLRVGLASGTALSRHGDWFGRPVNLASRVTARSRPGSVLTTEDVHDAAADGFAWSYAGEHRLKGVERPAKLFRARRPEPDG